MQRSPSDTLFKLSPFLILSVAVLLEMVELELFQFGASHHIWDAAVVALYSYVAFRISQSSKAALAVAVFGFVPWTMDLFDLKLHAFDFESAFWILEHTALAALLVRYLLRAQEIRQEELAAAVLVYLVAGLAFANVYGLILSYDPGALRYAGGDPGDPIEYALVVYYSFVTLATVGYGDITPTTPAARTVSVVQTLFGVIYIAVLISRFVSIHTANQFASREREARPFASEDLSPNTKCREESSEALEASKATVPGWPDEPS